MVFIQLVSISAGSTDSIFIGFLTIGGKLMALIIGVQVVSFNAFPTYLNAAADPSIIPFALTTQIAILSTMVVFRNSGHLDALTVWTNFITFRAFRTDTMFID